MFSFKDNFNSFSIVFLTANQVEQHIFLSNHKISNFFFLNWNSKLCRVIRYSDSWSFMFIWVFVPELFHVLKKWKNFTILKCHTIFDHVLKQSNFIVIPLQHECSPVNLLHIFRAPFPKNTSEELLLLSSISYQSSYSLFQKKSKQGIARTWNFQGYSVLKKEHVEMSGVN